MTDPMKTAIFLCLSAWWLTACQPTAELVNLTAEYLENPIGIDAPAPRLSWQLRGPERGVSQSAYEINVWAEEPGSSRRRYVWLAGKEFSPQSLHIPYGGEPLESGRRYYWQARTWDRHNEVSRWSEPALWQMGLLDAAVRGYGWCRANMTGKEYDAGVSGSALLAALELYKATGERKYKDFAYEMADRIVSLQVDPARDGLSPGGFFRLTPDGDTYYSEIARCDFAFTGLCELVSAFPGEDARKYKEAIRRYCHEYLAFLADKNAFGLLPYAVYGTPDASVRRAGRYGYRYFMDPSLDWWVGINANIAGKGVALIRAARLLNDPGLSARAQRQLDWIFGANPLGTCTMRGVGYEHPAFADAFYKDAERPGSEFFPPTPHIPGAVLNGIGGDADDMPQMIPGGWQTGEYWTPMVGLTLWLMAELTVLP